MVRTHAFPEPHRLNPFGNDWLNPGTWPPSTPIPLLQHLGDDDAPFIRSQVAGSGQPNANRNPCPTSPSRTQRLPCAGAFGTAASTRSQSPPGQWRWLARSKWKFFHNIYMSQNKRMFSAVPPWHRWGRRFMQLLVWDRLLPPGGPDDKVAKRDGKVALRSSSRCLCLDGTSAASAALTQSARLC